MHQNGNHLTVPRLIAELRHAVEGRHARHVSAQQVRRAHRGRAASRSCRIRRRATPVSGFTVLRGDSLNITGLTDTVTGANSQTLAYTNPHNY